MVSPPVVPPGFYSFWSRSLLPIKEKDLPHSDSSMFERHEAASSSCRRLPTGPVLVPGY